MALLVTQIHPVYSFTMQFGFNCSVGLAKNKVLYPCLGVTQWHVLLDAKHRSGYVAVVVAVLGKEIYCTIYFLFSLWYSLEGCLHARLVPRAERSSELCSLNKGSINMIRLSCLSHFFLASHSHACVWREPKDAFHSHCDWAVVKRGRGYGMPWALTAAILLIVWLSQSHRSVKIYK